MGKNSAGSAGGGCAQPLGEVAKRELLVLIGRQRLGEIRRRHKRVGGGCREGREVGN